MDVRKFLLASVKSLRNLATKEPSEARGSKANESESTVRRREDSSLKVAESDSGQLEPSGRIQKKS